MQNEIILLIILLVLSAFFSGSETALLSVSRLKVKHLFDKKRKGAVILKKLKDNPNRMLITILIGNNIVNVAAAAIATKIALDMGLSNAVSLSTGVMTLLLLVFGEVTPKSLVTQHYESISLLIARPIWILSIILYPFIALLNLFVKLLNKLFGDKREKPIVTEEELKSYVTAGEEAGSIKEIEKEMIQNIFKFDEINVEEIMTARPDMTCINVKSKVKNVLNIVNKNPYSRFPIYKKTRDHIVGILNVKDIYQYVGKKALLDIPITKLMRKPFFVPETKKIHSLLRQFQKRKEHMAIAIDEHGVVAGLVTIEDVLEEIVGEIVDESDRIMPNIKRVSKKSWIILGKTDLDDVNEKLKTSFNGKGFETFGGFILHKAGKIPKEKESVDINDKYTAVVEEMDKKRIVSVRLVRK
jgi:CBS domain containing-hemolysin-like protein